MASNAKEETTCLMPMVPERILTALALPKQDMSDTYGIRLILLYKKKTLKLVDLI